MTNALGQEDEEVLTNADIVVLTDAELRPNAIVTVIETKLTDFDVSVAHLAELSRAGVDSSVIQAIVGATADAGLVDEDARLREEGEAMNEYISLIGNRIQQNWIPSASAHAEIQCEVHVTQIPSGDIVDVRIGLCNGDEAMMRSIEAAVLRSSPLPRPSISSLFNRNLEFIFRPER